jgi:hypothetical protein
MPTLALNLPPELERKARIHAHRRGMTLDDYTAAALDLMISQEQDETRGATHPRDAGAQLAALFAAWREEPVDREEIERYPEQIEPLQLREVRLE